MAAAEKKAADTEGFSTELVKKWRQQVAEQREWMFRRNWKNVRQMLALRSKEQEEDFQFVVGWYEEFSEVVGRERERGRLDRIKALGLDVNSPNEKLPESLRV